MKRTTKNSEERNSEPAKGARPTRRSSNAALPNYDDMMLVVVVLSMVIWCFSAVRCIRSKYSIPAPKRVEDVRIIPGREVADEFQTHIHEDEKRNRVQK